MINQTPLFRVSPFASLLAKVIDTKKSITLVGDEAEALIQQIRRDISNNIHELRRNN